VLATRGPTAEPETPEYEAEFYPPYRNVCQWLSGAFHTHGLTCIRFEVKILKIVNCSKRDLGLIIWLLSIFSGYNKTTTFRIINLFPSPGQREDEVINFLCLLATSSVTVRRTQSISSGYSRGLLKTRQSHSSQQLFVIREKRNIYIYIY